MKLQRVPHVVIVGGGFGGLYAARALRRAPVRITLIDRRNHHLFQPLLYQVATAGLNASDIAAPIRRILRAQKNVTVLMAQVTDIDVTGKRVRMGEQELGYDQLIVATGATHAYFGHDAWAKHAPGLKSLEDAQEIRRRVLLAYEHAEAEPDAEARREWLTFVVVGAGPTGVELAGALGEIAHRTLASDFRNVDTREASILLLDASDRVLSSFPVELSESAESQLKSLGVEVRAGVRVTDIDESGIDTDDGHIPARTVLWAAGVKASSLARSLGVPLDRAGRVLVEDDLTIPGRDEIYVIGDLAALQQNGEWLPGVAPTAIQQGTYAANSILARICGDPVEPFRYRDKGSLATIGRARGVALFGKTRFTGIIAWWLWLAVHIFFLIGFRNRFVVMFEWSWAYWTWQRTNRVILQRAMPPENDDTNERVP
jgi:NADH:ubiquinone reductase (H+-translocating)